MLTDRALQWCRGKGLNMALIENRTFAEIAVGDTASLVRELTYKDVEVFAAMSGDVNPMHVDAAFAKSDVFHKIVADGMWGGALISTLLGTELPGPGTIWVTQSLNFRRPVGLGDVLTVSVTVTQRKTAIVWCSIARRSIRPVRP